MSVNKVILIGSVGQDPELRYMPNGEAVASFSLATNKKWKDKAGEPQERTEWHNIVIYRRLGEVAAEIIRKGSQVYIEGELQTETWKNKNQETRQKTNVVVSDFQSLTKREAGDSGKTSDYKPALSAVKTDGQSSAKPQSSLDTSASKSKGVAISIVEKQAPAVSVTSEVSPPGHSGGWGSFDDDVPFQKFPNCYGLNIHVV